MVMGTYAQEPTGYQARINDLLAYANYAERDEIEFEIIPLSVVDNNSPDESEHTVRYSSGSRLIRLIGSFRTLLRERPDADIIHLTLLPWYTLPLLGASVGKPLVFGPNIGSNLPLSVYDEKTQEVIRSVDPSEARRRNLYADRIETLKVKLTNLSLLGPVRYLSFSDWTAEAGLHRRGVPAEQVTILPYGVRQDIFYPPKSPKSGRNDSVCIFAPPDRAQTKGLKVLLEAVSELPSSLDDLSVNVIGSDSPPSTSWADDETIREKFNFVGRVSRKNLREQYINSDVLILPSYSEAGPNVMYEAIACGVPVIATEGDVFRSHAVGDYTLFFERGDSPSLASRIVEFYDTPDRYWDAAYQTASRYDIKEVYDTLLSEYKTMLKQSHNS